MSKKKKSKSPLLKDVLSNDDLENLGLDADGSSIDSIYGSLNSDNDRISGNPDGEDDQKNTHEPPGRSLLDDK
ncbi:hypothetical protein [Pedobacter nyackensis]|uniref:hypothetical protein n=1 Tax=Pedobacter nyackensis TaxID=475255 RepID=UPI00292DA1D4|nr:hypothetical protein [Pedobacter nyackensis]